MKNFKVHEPSPRKEESSVVATYPDYSSKEYWNIRYAREKGLSFDWLQPYESVREVVTSSLKGDKEAEILVVGCGNSLLSEKLYDEGYHYITNIDFSEVLIEEMGQRYAGNEEMDFHVMDVTSLDMDPESVQYVVDKGTLDCVFCAAQNGPAVKKMLESIHRVLAPGGSYICISHGEPQVRTPFFQGKLSWTLLTTRLRRPPTLDTGGLRSEAPAYHYAYALTKTM